MVLLGHRKKLAKGSFFLFGGGEGGLPYTYTYIYIHILTYIHEPDTDTFRVYNWVYLTTISNA